MNDEHFDRYLETLGHQLRELQSDIKPHLILEGDLDMLQQLFVQGWIPTATKIRMDLILGAMTTIMHLAGMVETSIKDYLDGRDKDQTPTTNSGTGEENVG